MIFHGSNNTTYTTAQELGRGGEGIVYAVKDNDDLVLKLYTEELPPAHYRKLEVMAGMASADVTAYAAWPQQVIHDSTGKPRGFIMRKLAGYVPLHHIFNPMDRKRMFPDKGYNFLIHVARNVAIAFHRLHNHNLVVGDVNEGNILVNKQGMVAFIDCDSFQVPDGDRYFFCQVGVPRYTPPELLRRQSFDKVVRTANTDNFSLAILLFQLLFLGRHPFAGRHKGAADIDEETAIRQKQFAYSLHNDKKKLTPPTESLPIEKLPEAISTNFHSAFETEERPSAATWIRSLDAMSEEIVQCALSKLHSYPSGFEECPWCKFRKEKGIMYFLDDSYLRANQNLINIEQFINGFNATPITERRWTDTTPLPELRAAPIPELIKRSRNMRRNSAAAFLAVGLLTIPFTWGFILTAIPLIAYIYIWSVWAKDLKMEKESRALNFTLLKKRRTAMIVEYEHLPDLAEYNRTLSRLTQLIDQYKQLPAETDKQKQAMEEALYNEQLNDYLRQFSIEDHSIPSIGAVKKAALYSQGIRHAGHIPLLATTKVPGIGPALEQVLLAWRRQMSGGFVYVPDTYRLNQGLAKVYEDINKLRLRLESGIRNEYQTLTFLKLNINNRAARLEKQIHDTTIAIRQAELDIQALRRYAA